MIRFRLARAGRPADVPLFTFLGLWAIYRATGGYPRRIITLCHQILLTLIIQNQRRAGLLLARSVSQRLMPESIRRGRWAAVSLTAVLFLVLIAFLFFMFEPLNIFRHSTTAAVPTTTDLAKSAPSIKPAAPATSAGTVESTPGQTQGNLKAGTPVVSVKEAAAPPKPARELKVPTSLGRLKIHEGGTVYWLLLEIYGSRGMTCFQEVVRANPQITDMNRVRAGELIAIPAVPAVPWPRDGKRVRIASRGSLDEAYGFYKEYPVYIKMLPFWNPREGMVFDLVLRKVFDSDTEARNAIRKLPATLAANAKIMGKPGADTVFFSN